MNFLFDPVEESSGLGGTWFFQEEQVKLLKRARKELLKPGTCTPMDGTVGRRVPVGVMKTLYSRVRVQPISTDLLRLRSHLRRCYYYLIIIYYFDLTGNRLKVGPRTKIVFKFPCELSGTEVFPFTCRASLHLIAVFLLEPSLIPYFTSYWTLPQGIKFINSNAPTTGNNFLRHWLRRKTQPSRHQTLFDTIDEKKEIQIEIDEKALWNTAGMMRLMKSTGIDTRPCRYIVWFYQNKNKNARVCFCNFFPCLRTGSSLPFTWRPHRWRRKPFTVKGGCSEILISRFFPGKSGPLEKSDRS